MEKEGIVLSVRAGMARVAVRRTSGCKGGCKTCSGCDTPEMLVELPDDLGVKPGDKVEIVANNGRVLKYTLLLYGIPMALFILGIALSSQFFGDRGVQNHELYSFLCGVICFAGSFLILRQVDRRLGNQDAEMMYMNQVVERLVK